MVLKYTLLWIPMVFIGIVNGAIRQFVYGPFLKKLPAHQVSSVTGIIFFVIYIWFVSSRWPFVSPR